MNVIEKLAKCEKVHFSLSGIMMLVNNLTRKWKKRSHIKLFPTSGLLQLLFPFSGMLLLLIVGVFSTSRSQLKCHILGEAFLVPFNSSTATSLHIPLLNFH